MGMLDAATCLAAFRKVEAGSTFHAINLQRNFYCTASYKLGVLDDATRLATCNASHELQVGRKNAPCNMALKETVVAVVIKFLSALL